VAIDVHDELPEEERPDRQQADQNRPAGDGAVFTFANRGKSSLDI
jgi:hypothetical protein